MTLCVHVRTNETISPSQPGTRASRPALPRAIGIFVKHKIKRLLSWTQAAQQGPRGRATLPKQDEDSRCQGCLQGKTQLAAPACGQLSKAQML